MKKSREERYGLTPEYLREVFDYDGENLIWKWRGDVPPKCNGNFAGKVAGYIEVAKSGYIKLRCRLNGKNYTVARLIWIRQAGEYPVEIDHIDGNALNNRIENLRSVSSMENHRNYKVYASNKSGYPGVCWDKDQGKWMVTVSGLRGRYWGRFKELDDAIAVAKAVHKENGYHKNHGAR